MINNGTEITNHFEYISFPISPVGHKPPDLPVPSGIGIIRILDVKTTKKVVDFHSTAIGT